jgi:cytochrome c556
MTLELLMSMLCGICIASDTQNNIANNKDTKKMIKQLKEMNKKLQKILDEFDMDDWQDYHRRYDEIEIHNKMLAYAHKIGICNLEKQKKD